MNTTLKFLVTAGLITISTALTATPNLDIQFNIDQQYSGRFTSEDPAIYDLGRDLAVIFYYDNEHDERVVVTTIAPKDPDSGRPASQHIVTLTEGERYRVTLVSGDPATGPIQVTVRFDGTTRWTTANP